MANSILTPTMITREAQRILHQKLNFVGSINRSYDDRFAKSGAKIGSTLQVRLPNQYTVRSGATLSAQDTEEAKVDLTVATQKGVDVNFTSEELTMELDDFSERILEPAMSVLAANIEADALNMYKDVYQVVDNAGSAMTFKNLLDARKKLTDSLTPTSPRSLLLNTQANNDVVDALKGLFQDSTQISKQYREGLVGKTAGFGNIFENTLLPRHTVGSQNGGYLVNDTVASGDSSVTVDTGTGTLKQGDVITFDGVNSVHPETKADSGVLKQFVITADYAGGSGTISISPAIISTGAKQNVSALPADNAPITVVGTASTAHDESLAFHRDAFAFATADLVMPSGVDFAAREVMDGISMRIVRDYDINNDKFPCRIDVLYGYKTIRPELAARILSN